MLPPLADPERALAVAYAPADRRTGLAALFALDERLGAIVAGTREPAIGLIRLAWWREAIEALTSTAPPAEPLLATLAAVISRGVPAQRIAAIEAGWAALLDGDAADDIVERHEQRGRTLFGVAAGLLGAKDAELEKAGGGWALADLSFRHSDGKVRDLARAQARALLGSLPRRWSRPAAALGALAVLARRDAATGVRRQGSPMRTLRMLALRVTGR